MKEIYLLVYEEDSNFYDPKVEYVAAFPSRELAEIFLDNKFSAIKDYWKKFEETHASNRRKVKDYLLKHSDMYISRPLAPGIEGEGEATAEYDAEMISDMYHMHFNYDGTPGGLFCNSKDKHPSKYTSYDRVYIEKPKPYPSLKKPPQWDEKTQGYRYDFSKFQIRRVSFLDNV
jgi:hypothetical protein